MVKLYKWGLDECTPGCRCIGGSAGVLQGKKVAGLGVHMRSGSGGYNSVGGELSEGMWFKLNVVEMTPGVTDVEKTLTHRSLLHG